MRLNALRELKRLYDALRQAGHRQYKTQLKYIYALLLNTPRFRGILELVQRAKLDFDADKWMHEHVFNARQTCHEWPDTETEKLKVLLRIMEVATTGTEVEPAAVGRIFTYTRDLDAQAQAFTEHVVFPIVDYLQTRLGTDSEVLRYLERMRRQFEWFDQHALYEKYVAETGVGEALYDRRVREFLFAEGIDYPFSQPASAAGRVDVVAGLDGEDPLVCEIKLYDGDSYGPPYIRQGMVQAVRYARDFGQATAYLVIFNLSNERLEMPSDDGSGQDLPSLHVEGVTVFIIVVQAKPLPSASKDRHREVRTIRREQIVPTAHDAKAD